MYQVWCSMRDIKSNLQSLEEKVKRTEEGFTEWSKKDLLRERDDISAKLASANSEIDQLPTEWVLDYLWDEEAVCRQLLERLEARVAATYMPVAKGKSYRVKYHR